MPQFILALLALVNSFSQIGKPVSLPPVTQNIVSQRGDEVSALSKSFQQDHSNNTTGNATGNATGNQSSNSGNNFGAFVSSLAPESPRAGGRDFGFLISTQAQNQTQNATENQGDTGNQTGNESASPDVTKVPANNVNSGFQMPTDLPQVALDHSRALEPVDPSGTPFPLPPGHRK